MSRYYLIRAGACLLALLLGLPAGRAQTATTQPANKLPPVEETKEGETSDEIQRLSPFVVEDTDGANTYIATSTLAGTRVRTDLKDTASAITVITSQFLKDTGVKSNQDLLIYTPSTEVAGMGGNFSGAAGSKSFNEASNIINPSNNNRVRGLDRADNTRDYFLTDIPWDSFNVGRIDLQRGPNSILFGVGSPAGIVNASVNDASFKNAYKLENVIDGYGSVRTSLDVNQVLLKKQLSLRLSALQDNRKYQQEPAFNNQKRIYGALRYSPNFFGEDNHTSLRVKFENGDVASNNPRILPPTDRITPWFTSAFNKATINTLSAGNGSLSTTNPIIKLYSPGGNISFQGAASTVDVRSFYEANSSNPTNIIVGMINNGMPGLNNGAYRALAVPVYTEYAKANLAGGSFYVDKVLTDSSVFNYYDNLLDGPNKHEWQSWQAGNIDLQQTFFKDMLAIDLTYDKQSYNNGQVSWLTGKDYSIGVDVNQTIADGSTNKNLGRPYVAASDAGGNFSTKIDRQSKRAIVTLDLKSEDIFGKGWVSYVLGRSVLTGLMAEDEKRQRSVVWAEHSTTPALIDLLGLQPTSLNSIAGTRAFDWVAYLGPTLNGASSASGANVSRLLTNINPGATSVVRYFNGTWNAAASVNKTDPYTYVDFNTNTTKTGTQADNPANYVGWTGGGVNWLSASNPKDFPSLVIGGNRQKFTDKSKGFTWQGYLLGGDLVPTFGWRKDTVVNYDLNAPTNSTTGIAALDYEFDPNNYRLAEGQSRNWSGVYHFPKKLVEKVMSGVSITALYNESTNFKADAPRRNLMGEIIANPQGKTREKGVVIGVLNDRVTFRANWFKTQMSNATLQSGASAIFGGGSYLMYQLTALGYTMAAMVQDAQAGISDGAGLDKYFADGGWTNYAYTDQVAGVTWSDNFTNTSASSPWQTASQTVKSTKMVQAWLNAPAFMNKSFFTFWNVPGAGLDPAAAKTTGKLHSALGPGGTTSPFGSFNYLVAIISPSASTLPVTTVDTLAKGQEFEIAANPIKNWNVSLNYVRTFATRTNLDYTTKVYMEQMNTFFSGDAGYLRLWGIPSYQASTLWRDNLWLPYQVALSSQGQSAPEVARWRLNTASNYLFSEGKLRGVNIGGAARLEAPRISGYRYSATLGYLDVGQPLMGPRDSHFDLWFGYTKKLNYGKLVWHGQVNFRNFGERTRLVPAYYEPDGSLALARIQEGMSWTLTNSVEF